MADKMNNLEPKKWLQYSFSIWKDIRKNKDEMRLKHPAMFPTQLTSRLINIFTKNDGEFILDPFMGSGTTAIACKQLGRNFIGCDNNKDYVKLAKQK